MNLCGGGIAGVTDQEFVFRFPDDEYSMSSRKKKSSSSTTTSRRDKSGRRQSSTNGKYSALLSRGSSKVPSKTSAYDSNSKQNYEKQRSRNQNYPLHGMKSSSILARKLAMGFKLTWINGGSKTQPVILSTNSDKSYLRIRVRPKDEEESENDRSKVNQRDMKIKIRHIAKIGSEAESSDRRRTESVSSNRSQNKYFIIRMKQNVSEYTKFKFLAQSLAERDSVVLSIRSLIDQGKHAQGSLPNKSQTAEHAMRPSQIDIKSFKALKLTERRNDLVEDETDSLNMNIPAPYNSSSSGDDEEFFDARDDDGFERATDSERDSTDSRDVNTERKQYKRESYSGKAYDSSSMSTRPRSSTSSVTKLNRSKAHSRMEKNNTSSKVSNRSLKKNVDVYEKSRQHQSIGRVSYNKEKTRIQRMKEHQRIQSMNKMSDAAPDEESIGSQTSALPALQDTDFSNLAANFANPVTGPWCTDDICTASLKDFADSMAGIFDLKVNRNLKGVKAYNNKNERAVAEEYIAGFLSNNRNMSELLSVKDLWNVAATKHKTRKEIRKMRLQNRVRNSNDKALRLLNLRNRMTFQGADTENRTLIQTIGSFDDIDRKLQRDIDDCEILCYDSDPEDYRECSVNKGPRAVAARQEENSNERNTKRREALDILDTGRFGLGRRLRQRGQDVLADIIEATKNEKLNLIWHPTQNNEIHNTEPVCVKVWVESGVYLSDGSFLLPKLTWLPAHEKKLESRVLNVSDNNPRSIELLDVCRVRECNSIDRRLHPFALVNRSFIIQTQTGSYLFEARSKQERGRVVNGLKLVIARLASLLMLKDLRAVDEFFGANAVPGEAPIWARGYEKKDPDADFPHA